MSNAAAVTISSGLTSHFVPNSILRLRSGGSAWLLSAGRREDDSVRAVIAGRKRGAERGVDAALGLRFEHHAGAARDGGIQASESVSTPFVATEL